MYLHADKGQRLTSLPPLRSGGAVALTWWPLESLLEGSSHRASPEKSGGRVQRTLRGAGDKLFAKGGRRRAHG